MTQMHIEYWPIEKLLPYERNPRKNDHAVEQAARLIKEFGFRVPVIVRGNGDLIDGHLRLKAAKQLGMDQVPVVRADDMTPEQVKAFRISVNHMADLAEWDQDLLRDESDDIRGIPIMADILDEILRPLPDPQSAEDIRAIEDAVDEDQHEINYEKEMARKDVRGKLPIVAQYLESHGAIIIVFDNLIDEAWLRQRLGLEEPRQSYKDHKIAIPNVITAAEFRQRVETW